MKKILLALVAMFAITLAANAADYRLDESAIDAVIENAVAVSPSSIMGEMNATMHSNASLSAGTVNSAAAIILNFFLGGFGVHRHYMGTRPWMWAIYTFTLCGFFGVVPFVDFIVMIVALVEDGSVGRYCGDTRFIMWG